MRFVRGLAGSLLATVLFAGETPIPNGPERFEYRQPEMGTEFQIVLYSADEATARRASDAAFARIAELNAAFSDYDPQSEIMRPGSVQQLHQPLPLGSRQWRRCAGTPSASQQHHPAPTASAITGAPQSASVRPSNGGRKRMKSP